MAARPDLRGKLDRTRHLMEKAIPDARVTEFEAIAAGLTLTDDNDRHVLAAAILCGAQVSHDVSSRFSRRRARQL